MRNTTTFITPILESTFPKVVQVIACTIFFCSTSFLANAQSQSDPIEGWQKNWYADYANNKFAIQIPFTQRNAQRLNQRIQLFRYRLVYIPAQVQAGKVGPLIRIGFFNDKKQAQEIIDASNFLFDKHSIVEVSLSEHKSVISKMSDLGAESSSDSTSVFAVGAKNSNTQIQNKKILDHAKNLYMAGNYEQAANQYSLLSIFASSETASWSTELLGLCYEKLKQPKIAISTYKQLLESYPESKGKVRVEQRLLGLETAANDGQSALRKSTYAKNSNQRRFFTRGNLGQYHRSLSRSLNDGDSEEVLSLMTTDFDLRTSAQLPGHNLRARINGFWIKDQLDNENSELRLKRVFVDYQHQGTGVAAKLGRQKEFNSGVFTSFDGLTVSYPILDNLKIAASAGEPIYYSDIYDDLDYSFYSTNVQWDINQHWQLSSYYNTQTLNQVTDREAVGVRAQYNDHGFIVSTNIDYDTAFGELNNLLLNLSYNINDALTLNGIYGQQRSPFLTATNILIGQSDLDLGIYLESKENQDSLLDDALARTSTNKYYNINLNIKVNKTARIIIDHYRSDLSDIPSNELLLGLPLTTSDNSSNTFSYKSYGIQFVAQNIFYRTDSATFGLRHSKGDTSQTTQIHIKERLRFGNKLFIGPKISYADTKFSGNRDGQQQLRLALDLSYKPFRNTELSLEAGKESISTPENKATFDSTYLFLGYRINF